MFGRLRNCLVQPKILAFTGGIMALVNNLPICSKVQGAQLQESREGGRTVVTLQYSARNGEWCELEFPTHQVKRLIDLLIPFQMEIEQDKD